MARKGASRGVAGGLVGHQGWPRGVVARPGRRRGRGGDGRQGAWAGPPPLGTTLGARQRTRAKRAAAIQTLNGILTSAHSAVASEPRCGAADMRRRATQQAEWPQPGRRQGWQLACCVDAVGVSHTWLLITFRRPTPPRAIARSLRTECAHACGTVERRFSRAVVKRALPSLSRTARDRALARRELRPP